MFCSSEDIALLFPHWNLEDDNYPSSSDIDSLIELQSKEMQHYLDSLDISYDADNSYLKSACIYGVCAKLEETYYANFSNLEGSSNRAPLFYARYEKMLALLKEQPDIANTKPRSIKSEERESIFKIDERY